LEAALVKSLRTLRIKAGFTRAELANRLNVMPHTIFRWEKGDRNPSLDMLQKICIELHTTESDLLNGPIDEGYKVTLKFAHKIEEVEDEMPINGCGAVTLADDGTVVASHKGKLFGREDKAEILSALDEKLDEALATIERRAERAKAKEAQ
jgi:transcriptional regulator with XRE-family HTH domain